MKRILLLGLVVGLFAGQASAAPYTLDVTAARQFTQQNVIDLQNELHLVIDNPGSTLSTTYVDDGYFGAPADYVDTMQLAVGFAGHITNKAVNVNVIWIGKAVAGELANGDTLSIPIANDNDDYYQYTAWYSTVGGPAAIVQGAALDLAAGTAGSVSVGIAGAPTYFGFTLDYIGGSSSDDFHTSVVPVPGAILLGLLGLSAAGLKLRRFA